MPDNTSEKAALMQVECHRCGLRYPVTNVHHCPTNVRYSTGANYPVQWHIECRHCGSTLTTHLPSRRTSRRSTGSSGTSRNVASTQADARRRPSQRTFRRVRRDDMARGARSWLIGLDRDARTATATGLRWRLSIIRSNGGCCPSCDHHTRRCWDRRLRNCLALAAWRGKPWRHAA